MTCLVIGRGTVYAGNPKGLGSGSSRPGQLPGQDDSGEDLILWALARALH